MNKRTLMPIVIRDLVCGVNTIETLKTEYDRDLYAAMYNAGADIAQYGSPTDIEIGIRQVYGMQTTILLGMSTDPITATPVAASGKPAICKIVDAPTATATATADPLSWVDPVAAREAADELMVDLGNGSSTQYPLRALTQPDLEALIGSCRSHIADYQKTLADSEAALIWRKDRASAVAASRAKAAARDTLADSIAQITALPIPEAAKAAAIAALRADTGSAATLPAGITVSNGHMPGNGKPAITPIVTAAPTVAAGMVKVATAREAAVPGFSEPLAHHEARLAGILAVPSDPKLALEYVRGYNTATPTATAPALTAREAAVSRAAATGATNKQIAASLNVATGTVKAAARKVKAKVGGSTRAATVLAATVPNVAAATNVNVNALITRLAGPSARVSNGKYDVLWNPANAAAFNALSPSDRHTFTLRARFVPSK